MHYSVFGKRAEPTAAENEMLMEIFLSNATNVLLYKNIQRVRL